MTLDLDAVGRKGPESIVRWDCADVMLYALSIGAGQDPLDELNFTTENTDGVNLEVIPTFAVVLAQRSIRPTFGDYDLTRVVHGEQSVVLHKQLPVEGSFRLQSAVTAIEDKGTGALVSIETTGRAVDSDSVVFHSTAKNFLRGLGGFSGARQAHPRPSTWSIPERECDTSVSFCTRPEQALLYRLNVDRNPLHSDPIFARRGGFARPILHGLCTYGFTARTLIHQLCNTEATRLRSIRGRFTRPVMPGDSLAVQIWKTKPGEARFRTIFDDGSPAIDQGAVVYVEPYKESPA
jgi:acyl dehydratase